eukprot:5811803-Pyramimonas_sp.AAC.1
MSILVVWLIWEGSHAVGHPLEDLGAVALVADLLQVELLVPLEDQLVAQPRQEGLLPDLAAALAPPLEPALEAARDALERALGCDLTWDLAGQPGAQARLAPAQVHSGAPATSEAVLVEPRRGNLPLEGSSK